MELEGCYVNLVLSRWRLAGDEIGWSCCPDRGTLSVAVEAPHRATSSSQNWKPPTSPAAGSIGWQLRSTGELWTEAGFRASGETLTVRKRGTDTHNGCESMPQ